ncbi:MAG TPA: hypothetical protein VFW00_09625 [Rhodocyclaceae bacterium]|nr:hypothetical protein [Rhodocyclaceae bacterium]
MSIIACARVLLNSGLSDMQGLPFSLVSIQCSIGSAPNILWEMSYVEMGYHPISHP